MRVERAFNNVNEYRAGLNNINNNNNNNNNNINSNKQQQQ